MLRSSPSCSKWSYLLSNNIIILVQSGLLGVHRASWREQRGPNGITGQSLVGGTTDHDGDDHEGYRIPFWDILYPSNLFVSLRMLVRRHLQFISDLSMGEHGRITFLEIKATNRLDPSSQIWDRGKYVVAALRNRLWSAEQIMDGGKRQILHGGRHKSSPAGSSEQTVFPLGIQNKQRIDFKHQSCEVFSSPLFASCETDLGGKKSGLKL